jgi:Tol biopolymer transport system component
MPRVADILDRESLTVDLEQDHFERLLGRRERKQRNRRIRAGALGVIVALAMGTVLVRSLTSDRTAVFQPTPTSTPAGTVSGALTYLLGNDIYVGDPDGSNAVKIVDALAEDECTRAGGSWNNEFPAWSPDGRYIAFWHTCSGSGQEETSDVMITDPLGDVVAEFPKGMWGFTWSPDSTRIAVWGDFPRTVDVYGIDGERQASLGFPSRMAPHNDAWPGWMPDGSAILLDGAYVVPLDGSAPYDLSLGGMATYSPDGTHVAVATDGSIRILRADGSVVSQVNGVEGVEAWSPDGQLIASVSHQGDLIIVDVASGTVTALPEAKAALNAGKIFGVRGFSPEGDRILYFTAGGTDADAGLWSIAVDGSDPRLLVVGALQGGWRSR